MKIIGNKLRSARQIRNLTITALAKDVGVSKQAISLYECDALEPRSDILSRIINRLEFPLNYFTTDFKNDLSINNTFFRALMSAPSYERNSYIEKTKLVTHIYDYINEILNLPELNLPCISKQIEIDSTEIEKVASLVREEWGLGNGPIWDVIGLLESHGIVVSIIKQDYEKIDGFTQVDEKNGNLRYFVILDDEKKSMARRNFSAAHELGHILLHKHIRYDECDSIERSNIENQANYFASCLLLPSDSFKQDLKNPLDYDNYVFLKQKWHVSIKAMFVRAKHLGLINYDGYISLLKKYNYRITRANQEGERFEPFDDIIRIKNPTLFQKALSMLFEEGNFTLETFFSDLEKRGLALNEAFLYTILPLPVGFFDKYKKEDSIIRIDFKRNSSQSN